MKIIITIGINLVFCASILAKHDTTITNKTVIARYKWKNLCKNKILLKIRKKNISKDSIIAYAFIENRFSSKNGKLFCDKRNYREELNSIIEDKDFRFYPKNTRRDDIESYRSITYDIRDNALDTTSKFNFDSTAISVNCFQEFGFSFTLIPPNKSFKRKIVIVLPDITEHFKLYDAIIVLNDTIKRNVLKDKKGEWLYNRRGIENLFGGSIYKEDFKDSNLMKIRIR